ncbi:D-tyrosyl-tRNA(Tyr) deacylase [Actinomycetospora succinea]|uniref:D-aminoacyl-tRNA deacylase n=1 Tax=Actinomycetospora succinea TaxID=663603 RepID=A0A4R6VT64_9PSEU|nr:D-aminoacyl-tRNA deacylase [Actinomycetospora succinea]TDQ65824.1 D-tyrosyl-tRNA(Tyr) deacylase [Actinomycetospora succinea]
MRAVVSRVTTARVVVDGSEGPEVVGALEEPGLLVLLGVHRDDGPDAAATMARKLHELRILRDERTELDDRAPRSYVSCADTGAGLLVVSQFTLYGDTRKGRRPSWSAAAGPDAARAAVDAVVAALRERGAPVATGKFRADMRVESTNDGPFTVIVES